jgi:hypothetical protein
LLAGYLTTEEALSTPRGRILFDEQIRRRMGYAFPVEVRTTSSPRTFWKTDCSSLVSPPWRASL